MTKFIWLISVVFILGCSNNRNGEPPETLYQQLGGEQGIEKLVDAFILKIARDPQIFPYFSKSSVSHFKKGISQHLCDLTGGPCHYQSDTMVDIHTGMNINESDFNRVVELLVEAMEDVNISYTLQNQLLLSLVPLRKNIIKL